MTKLYRIFTHLYFMISIYSQAQYVLPSNTSSPDNITFTGCQGTITKSAKTSTTNYELIKLTIFPPAVGQFIEATVAGFINSNSPYTSVFSVYDGIDYTASKMGEYSDKDFIIKSGNPSGAINIVYGATNYTVSGFEIKFACATTAGQYLNFPVPGGSQSFSFTGSQNPIPFGFYSNISWTITGVPSWISMTSTTGFGSSTITYTVDTLKGFGDRSTTLTIAGSSGINKQYEIYQSGYRKPNEGVTTMYEKVTQKEGGITNFFLYQEGIYDWNISNSIPGWLSISPTSGSGGSYMNVLTVTSQPNHGKDRSHTFAINYPGGKFFYSIFQPGDSSVFYDMPSVTGSHMVITACSGIVRYVNTVLSSISQEDQMLTIVSDSPHKKVYVQFKAVNTTEVRTYVYDGPDKNGSGLIFSNGLDRISKVVSTKGPLTIHLKRDYQYDSQDRYFYANIGCTTDYASTDLTSKTIKTCDAIITQNNEFQYKTDQNGGDLEVQPGVQGSAVELELSEYRMLDSVRVEIYSGTRSIHTFLGKISGKDTFDLPQKFKSVHDCGNLYIKYLTEGNYNIGRFNFKSTCGVLNPVNSCGVSNSPPTPPVPTTETVSTSLAAQDVSIYPNPTDGILTIIAPYNILKAELFDLSGTIVSLHIPSSPMQMSIFSMTAAPGVYFLKIFLENHPPVMKKVFIK